MFSDDRRRFLRQAATAGVAASASRVLGGASLFANAKPMNATDAVRIYIDSRRTISPLDQNLFGSFLEHLGRAIYEGIYDPGSLSPFLSCFFPQPLK
jgi:hypothetical protein